MRTAAKGTPLCLSILSPDWLTSLHTRGRGSQACSGSSQCAGVMGRQAQVLRLGVAQVRSDVAGVWVQILDGRHSGRSHRC